MRRLEEESTVLCLSWLPGTATGSAYVTGALAREFSRGEMVVLGEKGAVFDAGGWDARWPELIPVRYERPFHKRGLRFWRKAQFPAMLLRCLYHASRRRCGAVFVTYPDGQMLAAGYLVSRVTGASLYPYFHNMFVENQHGVSEFVSRCLQDAVFRRAKCAFLMSEGMARLFAERYPFVPTMVVPHAVIGPLPPFEEAPPPCRPIKLAIAGNVNESCLDAVQRVARVVQRRTDVELTIISGTNRSALRTHGLLGRRVTHVTPSDGAFRSALRSADVLLLPLGLSGPLSGDEYATIFPTRTIEYMVAGRPIVAHAPADSFLVEYLAKNDCALVVTEPDEGRLSRAIDTVTTDRDFARRLARNAYQSALAHQAANVADAVRARIGLARRSPPSISIGTALPF